MLSNLNPDIIALSETKLKIDQTCKLYLEVEGYKFIHNGSLWDIHKRQ